MDKKGFTLVELLIAMVVGLVIMAAIYGMMNLGQRSSASVDRKVLTQQDVRAVLDLMAMEIRMASFNPTRTAATWGTVPTCNAMGLTTIKPTRKGIQIATPSSILIAMDLWDGVNTKDPPEPDSIIGGTAANEYISYAYNSVTGTITRIVDCVNSDIILGADGSSTKVVNDANTPVFQYIIIDPLTNVERALDPALGELNIDNNIAVIRRIRITIVADVETQGSIQVSRRTYSTDVLVRNHVLSP
jgi:prepilin-type N-terminal cleavage/methylation domain-containing protein